MHIGFVTSEYPGITPYSGGIGSFIKGYHQLLIKNGFEATVFLITRNSREINMQELSVNNNVVLIEIKHKFPFQFFDYPIFQIKLSKLLNKHIKNKNIDILEVPDFEGITAFCKLQVPVVCRLHGSNGYFNYLGKKPISFFLNLLEKRILKKSQGIIAVSNYSLEIYRSLYNLDNKIALSVIPNIVDDEKIIKIQNSSNLKPDSIKIIYTGTLNEKKGVLDLPEAINELSDRFDNLQFIFVGKDTKYKENITVWEKIRSQLSEKAKSLTTYKGFLDHDKALIEMKNAQICLFPNHNETFGLVLLEAMFMGKAIACSDNPCFEEILGNSDCSKKFSVGSVKEMVNCLEDLIGNETERKYLGEKARNYAQSFFGSSTIIKQNIDFYKNIISFS